VDLFDRVCQLKIGATWIATSGAHHGLHSDGFLSHIFTSFAFVSIHHRIFYNIWDLRRLHFALNGLLDTSGDVATVQHTRLFSGRQGRPLRITRTRRWGKKREGAVGGFISQDYVRGALLM
jgi:hypothetical protein